MPSIDLNCDMGESYGRYEFGQDERLMPYLSSCNIACGFHAGDPLHIIRTIEAALRHGLHIGAHPSYPDLQGFGRRYIQVDPTELRAIIQYQVAALKGLVESRGGKLSYVKPHGALYHRAAIDKSECEALLDAIERIDPDLALMGLAGSQMEALAKSRGQAFVAEAFADRIYAHEGKLTPRSEQGAIIQNPDRASQQALSIVSEQRVENISGGYVEVQAESICVHGDHPRAYEILQAIRMLFDQEGIAVKSTR